MNYQQFLNNLSQEIRNKSLSDLESNLIKLLEHNLTYSDIAVELGYEDGYIGDVARELYGLINQKHQVKVTRNNLFSVLDSLLNKEPEPDFYVLHGLAKNVLQSNILEFNQNNILISVSLFWKFDAINRALIYKNKYPIVFSLDGLNKNNLGDKLISITKQKQLSGDALLELVKILDGYFI